MPIDEKLVYRKLDDLEKFQLHGILKGHLEGARVSVRKQLSFEYFHAPTCLKCGNEGYLSKIEGSKLICLKCGAKYELRGI